MNCEPLILAIETATLAGSISISKGENVIGSSKGDPVVSHSNTLLADVDKLLGSANLKVDEVDVFAVAAGPGSFTGLRIGIATIKALATTLDRPCIGIPTLEAIAHAAGSHSRIVALLPAGRGEVFCQMFSTSHGRVHSLDEPAHLSPARMIELYGQLDGVVWAGDGAKVHSQLINESVAPRVASIVESPVNLAQHVASLARAKLATEANPGTNELHAIYVRPSDAELKF